MLFDCAARLVALQVATLPETEQLPATQSALSRRTPEPAVIVTEADVAAIDARFSIVTRAVVVWFKVTALAAALATRSTAGLIVKLDVA